MKLEHSLQKQFIRAITKQEELREQSKAIKVYEDLIYYRFLEVFEKAYPRFKKMLSEEKFRELIYKFLEIGAKDPILWRVSGEFKEFLLKNNDLKMNFLDDLLEFEFLEVQMYMHKYKEFEEEMFSLDMSYEFSLDAALRTFTFAVHHPEFDTNIEIFEEGEYTVLFYYDEKTQNILYEEITAFVAQFLQTIRTDKSILSYIEEMASLYETTSEELLEILLPVLQNYKLKNIITKS